MMKSNETNMRKHQIHPFILISLVGMGAFILLFGVTIYGPGVSPDSTVYIETANNLVAGKGFYAGGQPLTHYPPGYPLLLALSNLARADMLATGRLLHALLFAINAMLITTAAYTLTKRHRLLVASCTAILFLSSAPILSVHAMAWSESPFIMFSFAGLFLLALYVANSFFPLLIAASVLLGFATVTRYIGIVLFLPLTLGLLAFNQKPITHRIRDFLVAVTVMCIPIGSWLLRNLFVAGSITNRNFTIHLISLQHFEDLVNTLFDFVLPLPISIWIESLFLVLLSTLFIAALKLFYRKYQEEKIIEPAGIAFVSLNVIFIFSYLAFLFISISFFDAHTPLDNRILLPVFIPLVVVTVIIISSLLSGWQKPIIRLGLFFFLSLVVGLNGFYVVYESLNIHNNGLGYTSRLWRDSVTVTAVNTLDTTVTIYSNGPDVLGFWTRKNTVMIPSHFSPTTLEINEDYETQLQVMCIELNKSDATVVYLHNINREYLPSWEELESKCKIAPANSLEDGKIYGIVSQKN
jgi:hypothetical protein